MKCNLKIIQCKSKKTGKDFRAVELRIGLYKTLLFPTAVEMDYLDNLIHAEAHDEFQEDEDYAGTEV